MCGWGPRGFAGVGSGRNCDQSFMETVTGAVGPGLEGLWCLQ